MEYLKSSNIFSRRILCIGFFILILLIEQKAFANDIYLSPMGNDLNDGSQLSKAVATLQQAVKLASTRFDNKNKVVNIIVQAGNYYGQTVLIDKNSLNIKLIIAGQPNSENILPSFIGDGSELTWLTLKSSSGMLTGLEIRNISIRSYFTAISLEGNRRNSLASNSGTIIKNNIFENIGAVATTSKSGVSTAAIRFVNSKNNLIEFNTFKTIRNLKECYHLHALYFAHYSSGNMVRNNTFTDTCGSVIRLRDRSNENIIENNRFIKLDNVPAIQEWYCDRVLRNDCTNTQGECPSTRNMQRNNVILDSNDSELIVLMNKTEKRSWCSVEDFDWNRIN